MNETGQTTQVARPSVQAAVAEWLLPIRWQLFATLEFPWKAKPETATLKFDEMIDKMERTLRTRVCYVNASETRSKSGAQVPLHIHASFTSARPIPHQLVAGIWNEGVGRTNSVGGDLARVEPFNPAMGGIAYTVKLINDSDCEWGFRNLHLFNPNIQIEPKTDHVSLRLARRWQAQNAISCNQPGVFLRAA
jgi:hypothetical protein